MLYNHPFIVGASVSASASDALSSLNEAARSAVGAVSSLLDEVIGGSDAKKAADSEPAAQ